MTPEVVHEDDALLIFHKPPGLATTSPKGGECLTTWAEERWERKLHPTSRLDAEVSGLVTFAKDKRANAALLDARRKGEYGRGYLALASAPPASAEGEWNRSIAIDPRDKRRRIAVEPDAKGERVQRARTRYRVRATAGDAAALWLTPFSGRTHQLRVHASHAGSPLLGDVHYGGPRRVVLGDGRVVRAARTMLHCAWLSLPMGRELLVFECAPPEDFTKLWHSLGGSEDALAPRPRSFNP